jgi:eukaryotic-like serine/threonine-protein kinase
MLNNTGVRTCTWNLEIMRDVTLALAQLHKGGIAHQDIKPSNVVSVAAALEVAESRVKVGDLGRVVRRDVSGPFNTMIWPGDQRYMPPERWYAHMPSDWTDAREAADAYMVGSLLLFLFTGVSLQMLAYPHLPDQFKPGTWRGAFDQDLLAVLQNVHDKVLVECLLPNVVEQLRDDVFAIAKALTQPDPKLRGDPRARQQVGRPLGMDRIHQKFLSLARRSSVIDRGRRPA